MTPSFSLNWTPRRRHLVSACRPQVSLMPLAASAILLRRIRMSIAAELLQRHIQILVDDHRQWQTLIAEHFVGTSHMPLSARTHSPPP